MIINEIYILSKHGNFEAEYIENIPVYKRRYYLNILNEEFEKIEKYREREMSKVKKSR